MRKSVDAIVDKSEEETILSLGGRVIIDPKGFETLRDSKMVSDKQAQGRGIRAYPRAMNCRWAGSKALRGSLVLLSKRVSRPEVFLERFSR
jgi:hypothetical protein